MLPAERKFPEGLQNCRQSQGSAATAVGWRAEPQLPKTRALRTRRARCRLKSEFALKRFRISGRVVGFGGRLPRNSGRAPHRRSRDR
jgi:hypothetical protein